MIDADNKIVIRVTERDIRNGKMCAASSCPIALAAKRVFVDKHWIAVAGGRIKIYEENPWCGVQYEYDLPAIAIEFIQRYDCDIDVGPFEFEINIDK